MLRRSKFNNRPDRCCEGVTHQSQLESRRCTELHLMQKGGLIRDLEAHPQPRFRLDVNGVHVCSYIADFRWTECDSGEVVVADAKGFKTREYELKKRLMLACHGIEICELRSGR